MESMSHGGGHHHHHHNGGGGGAHHHSHHHQSSSSKPLHVFNGQLNQLISINGCMATALATGLNLLGSKPMDGGNQVASNNNNTNDSVVVNGNGWTLVSPKLMAIAIGNYIAKSPTSHHYLPLYLGDVVVIVEQCTNWFRGYLDNGGEGRLGIFPASHVLLFENLDSTTYYFKLMDPLCLQVCRTLREWHQLLNGFYRTNTNQEKYQLVRKLMVELIDLCGILSRDLAPTLWRRRTAQLLNSTGRSGGLAEDPFETLYGDEDVEEKNRQSLDISLEELHERVLSKLNLGNHLLNLDLMPSFTYGTFASDHCMPYSQLIQCDTHHSLTERRKGKLKPYYQRPNSKYLTLILDYYNRLCRKLAQRPQNAKLSRNSLSFHSPLHTASQSSSTSMPQSVAGKKYRRHLLFTIREANFASLFAESDPTTLQIDVYLVRCSNNSVTDSSPYEILTEKYCYRVGANGTQLTFKHCNLNRALFLDVLSKKSSTNGASTPTNGTAGASSFTSHTDSANYYLVMQVWRYGRMIVNESRTKNMLTATMSTASATGSSVFHTISSSSISSAATAVAAAASTTSLSSITSFVTNVSSSSLFYTGEKATASSTPDSTSIDSSEFGGSTFKRSVGFSVVPLLELVSRDQELKSTTELLNNDAYISRLLLADESMLVSIPIKLFEGDLTVSALESMLKYRTGANSCNNNTNNGNNTPSKLSPLTTSYQLIVSAKFISELLPQVNSQLSKRLPNPINFDASPPVNTSLNSLGDYLLLLSQNGAKQEQPNSFVLVQKRSFGDLMTAGYFRNDFYLTLESVEFEKGGKTIPKNIEVTVCLITENGIQERAISSGANDEPVTFFRSHIQYHQNCPKWLEHVKVNVPLEQFESAHLRFIFCHCSSKERERKFLGFSFLPLADKNGACLSDGEHELCIYKCDNERKLDDVTYYLEVPWTSKSLTTAISTSNLSTTNSQSSTSLLLNSRSSKEVFHVKTNLISSKLTQNSDILSLLKWSCTPLDQVNEALQRMSRVPGEEMVKFLEDILDALFSLFTNSTDSIESSPQVSLIFRVLIDFLKILNDPKFVLYRASLETYIENQFSASLVHSGLMACVKKYIELVIISFQSDTTTLSGVTKRELEFILRCLSVFDWILKFIVQSRILYTRASDVSGGDNSNESAENFKAEILSLFTSINRLLSVESKSSDDYLIIAIQESVLNTLPQSFDYMSQILSPLELAKLIKSTVHSNRLPDWSPTSSLSVTPTNPNATSSTGGKRTIINAKLLLLQKTIRCRHVWSDQEARLELLDTFIRLQNVCISESKHCLAILHDVIVYLIDNSPQHYLTTIGDLRPPRRCDREIEMLSFGAIDSIVEHIIELTGVSTSFDLLPIQTNRTNSTSDDQDYLGNFLICFLVLLDCMELKNYEKLFETRSTRQCKELLLNIFVVFLNALYYFADNWLEIKMAVNRVILHSLTMLRTIMSQEFLGPEKFDVTIWRTYFKLAIAFLTQQRLQLESQPYWKRQLIVDTYGGDLRILMGFELVACWDLIGPYKISFIPSLVASFVDVTLVPEVELRKATIPIFYDMLAVDYENNSNFKQVESALIDKLDVVAHRPECDLQFTRLFTLLLTEQIDKHHPPWHSTGLQLVNSMSRLLTLLIDYRNELKLKSSICSTKNANEVDDRLLISTYALLRFFRDEIDSTNRKQIMLRYVDKLSNLHILQGNYSEAAFTLQLHADLLAWSPNEAAKKESLCETMLGYFERGQCWEEGIRVCRDLQTIYERSFKFNKLSQILKKHSELLDKILTQHRPDSEYFRVSFFGLDFPFFLQNTTFVFRAQDFEKISSFTHRIQREFPKAQLLTKNIPTDENITESNCQYIQIFAVKPLAEPPVTSDQSLIFGTPDNVLTYYNTNSVRQFIQDRPIQRAPFDPNNEFKSLWIERTIYTTEKPLPGILRMFQVANTQVTYLSPIENACETIENMNNELSKLIVTYSSETNRPESISPLSMRLQGILDAAVNGGISKYIEAFLSSEFLSTNPDQVGSVNRLKSRIAHQIKMLESGLSLHGKLAPTAVRPLHTRLLERFATMRNTVNQANIEISTVLQWTPSSTSTLRPSILSQPLPPIPPNHQRQDTGSSDPETSSLSSSSSLTERLMSRMKVSTPPLPQTQPPFMSPSVGGKIVKSKPLPPLPSNDGSHINNGFKSTPSSPQLHRNHSVPNGTEPTRTITRQLFPVNDDNIYSVPQMAPDLMTLNDLENESSVDGNSLDYCEVQQQQNGRDVMDGNCRSIYRSRSIPRSSISLYTNGETLNGQAEVDTVPPPPLPPRASTLDRSNSLNSSIKPTPLVPPALPQRPVRKTCSANQNGNSSTPLKPTALIKQDAVYFDDIEFENLLISSPTPRSENSAPPSRPAPIIGIEIDSDSDLLQATPTIITESSFIETTTTIIHRSKSSSLPQQLLEQASIPKANDND